MVKTVAVVLEKPEHLALRPLELPELGSDDVLVSTKWTGISTGTEKLLWSGRMPPFPGLGYPLVPGYETVGEVVAAGSGCAEMSGRTVFVPGANCYGSIRGLFGGAASHIVVPARRTVPLNDHGPDGILLALAATAHHALMRGPALPELIVGHGILGRLLARLTMALGGEGPTVWERNPLRLAGGRGYRVVEPDADQRRDYRVACDASGDSGILDALVSRLARNGEIVLAGFYESQVHFTFPPAFMREVQIRIAAEWQRDDFAAVQALVAKGRLPLDGLISHRAPASSAPDAYGRAFTDPACLKMVLDWREAA